MRNHDATAAETMAAARDWTTATTAGYASIIQFIAARGFLYSVQPGNDQDIPKIYGLLRDASVIVLPVHPKRGNLQATTLPQKWPHPWPQ